MFLFSYVVDIVVFISCVVKVPYIKSLVALAERVFTNTPRGLAARSKLEYAATVWDPFTRNDV